MNTIQRAIALIKPHESLRLEVYDDVTGLPLNPGDTLRGHPTIGWGRALDVEGLTKSEAAYLLDNDLHSVLKEIWAKKFSFWKNLSLWRRAVIVDMVYNMGIAGFMEFDKMIAALRNEHHSSAAEQLKDSAFFRETKIRGKQDYCIMKFDTYYSEAQAKSYFNARK